MRFFLFKRCLPEIENPKFSTRIPEGRLKKLEQNEIFNDFAISQEPIDEIDSNCFCFKGMDQKIPPDPTGPDRMKIADVGAE